jgi:hypothetical protein
VIVREVARQDAAQVAFAQDEDVIQALTPDRTDEPFREGVLPRAGGRGQDFGDPHALHALPERGTIGVVTIAQEIGRRGVVREGVHDLLGGPVGRGVLGDVEVDHTPAMVGEHDEDKEHTQAAGTVKKSMATTSRTWLARNVRQVCDGGARRFGISRETVRSATSMPSFLSSPWILGAPHRRFIAAIFLMRAVISALIGGRAHPRAVGEPRPVLTEATVLPPQDRVGRHDDQSLPPAGPDSGQPNPQEAICPAQPGPGYRSLVHGELVTQGEVLEGEVAVAPAEEREESQQVEQEGNHQAQILSGSELINQPLARRMEFWRRTGCDPKADVFSGR